MDGYTVEETASVLGVPRERVWELIARGVLSAAPDLGGAMRVRLKADAPQPPQRAQPDAPPAETGAGAAGASFADPSPFRELLTEFRGLTERYGQALLALGEARGEVAGLRARVEVLEARVDLRLPAGTAATVERWGAPQAADPERVVRHEDARDAAPPADPEAADGEGDDDRSAQRRRAKGGRRATEAFAEALARADDPNAPELPGARDAAAAWAALRDSPRAVEATDAALPRELPAADDVPVAEEEAPPPHPPHEPHPQQEPTPAQQEPTEAEAGFAAGDGSEATFAAEGEVDDRPREPAPAPPEPAAEAAPAAVEATERDAESAHEMGAGPTNGRSSDAGEAAVRGVAEAESHVAEPVESAPAAVAADVVEQPPPVAPAGEAHHESQWADDRYTTEIEEPAWFTAEELGLETAAAPPPAPPPAADGAPRDASAHDSGSQQLDEGLAALDALAHPGRIDVPPRQAPPPSVATRDVDRGIDHAARSSQPSDHDQSDAAPWSRPREQPAPAQMRPASRAYRRLRRIFPD